ncbi:N6-adenosine-methyltransferase non-catalytic subunit MTB isoform X2 [Diospyros lotus]|uniref:N6-adenosine-methyltransferase non-catalytic subunit MTB isoform X2 n=1 Tax=Diospyros lotus TaxID=55363 RepID=UPI00224FD34E|nr:N6-adenosine-methyltransferase non-catalytic subunit MTB isoform X2 [Diospyros lotus]
MEDVTDMTSDKVKDIEEWDGDDKRKQRSSKSKKPGNGEEAEGLDGSGRRRSAGDRSESRKRSLGSSRENVDIDDSESRKESRSKQMKESQEESTLEKLSSWYQDGEQENKYDGIERSVSRGPGQADEGERKKLTPKFSDHDSSQSRIRGKDDRLNDREFEKSLNRDSRHSERKETNQEKDHGSSEQGRSQRRRWDDSDAVKKAEEGYLVEKFDTKCGIKQDSAGERSMTAAIELGHSKSRALDSSERGIKSHDREARRIDSESSKSKGRTEAAEDDNKRSPLTHEERSGKERFEKHRQQRGSTSRDIASHERPFNTDEDGTWMREKSRREGGHSRRSKTPERSGRQYHETENLEMNYERGASKRKELEKDGFRDDKLKGRDDSWSDWKRDQEGYKDNWKRRQPSGNEKDTKDGDMDYDHGREWELQRHGYDRTDNERRHSRSGGRKDGGRTGAVKTSSNYGISNENYDVIEIQTRPFDYGGEESRFSFARRTETPQQPDKILVSNDEQAYTQEDRARKVDYQGTGPGGDDLQDGFMNDGPMRDQNSWKDENDFQGGKTRGQEGVTSNFPSGGQSYSSSSLNPQGNQESGSYSRAFQQGAKGGRVGRGARGRTTGRDNQPFGIPMPIIGPPFGPLAMPPPGPMQSLTPGMSPTPGPPISPSVFIPPFSPPVVWPGARGLEMNMLSVPPGLSPVPPGPSGPRFPPNLGNSPNPAFFFNQPGPGREPPNISAPGLNAVVPVGRGQTPDKASGSWVPPRTNGPPGKAPSRGEQNDYSQNFVDTGMRPQNFIRELELTAVVEDYPKLRELIQKKDEIVAKSASPPMYYKCDLREHVLSPEFFGTKFDVILVDPPWEEYVHRAPGVTDHMEYWTFEEIMNLKIEAIADTPSFVFLWVGDGLGLEQGRQCLKKWGFRRCEDICWVKTNKSNATPGLRHDSHTLFQRSKEHCLMGIKGTVRRSTDGHIIHANIDTDVIIAEEPPYGSTAKPEDMYRIIEHFALGRRRVELFGEDHNIRSGWLTMGKGLSSSNFNAEAYIRNFSDRDGKVWQGGGGRNPPPEAPHLVLTTSEIEALRPKSPMKNQQQLQQSASISLTTAGSTNRLTTGPWASSMETYKGGNIGGPEHERHFDMYGYNVSSGQANPDYRDYETHRAMNFL